MFKSFYRLTILMVIEDMDFKDDDFKLQKYRLVSGVEGDLILEE